MNVNIAAVGLERDYRRWWVAEYDQLALELVSDPRCDRPRSADD
jgi:hypothetical protein